MCDLDMFPEFPDFEADWIPIYFEPILLSGERITIAIVVIDYIGGFKIFPTLREEVLDSLYGIKSKNLSNIINHCEESIREHLKSNKPFELWQPPFKGVFQGKTTPAADDSVFKVAQQAIQRCSSLSSLSMAAERDYDDDSKQNHKVSQRWQEAVIKSVLVKMPSFEDYFKVKIAIDRSKTKTQFGFLSDRTAINFGVLSGFGHSSSLNTIKARILDLEHLMNSNSLVLPEKYAILIKIPSQNDVSITESIKEKLSDTIYTIQDIGQKSNVTICTVETSEMAANKIIEIAA